MEPSTITSTVAIVLSAIAIGWNIYRDAIQKPKFRVSIALKSIHQMGKEPDGPHIFVEALNMGPLPNRANSVFARPSWFGRKIRKRLSAYISPDWNHMAATKPAQRIEVGDTATFVFPFAKECFLSDKFAFVGVSDGYGRTHWAPRKQLRNVQAKYRQKFGEACIDTP